MENINLNKILNRETIINNIELLLEKFKNNTIDKKGIYIYGNSGIGKTKLILDIVKNKNFDIIYYDNTTIRNKFLLENTCTNTQGNINVYSLFKNEEKKIVIILDDIDTMNNGDKNGIISLIKLIRIKKTKKQKLEKMTNKLIICINNNSNDKKILELIKVCNSFEINTPSYNQMDMIINKLLPNIYKYDKETNNIIKNNMLEFLDNNLKSLDKIIFYEKYDLIYNKFYSKNNNILFNNSSDNIKNITKNLLEKYLNFDNINYILETDRTIISLLFHENVIKILSKNDKNIYLLLLDNFIFCDYIDRIIFQKQIWQLTEINYIIKIFYNNYLLKKFNLYKKLNFNDIIFTKILTKYSSEYNNYVFLYNILQHFLIDKNDIYIYFENIFNTQDISQIYDNLLNYNISNLEIIRLSKIVNNIKNNNTYDIQENDLYINNIENLYELNKNIDNTNSNFDLNND